MNEYLKLLSGALGVALQVARGNGVSPKILIPSAILVMGVGVWVSGAPGEGVKVMIGEALIWIVGTVAAMFTTARASYAYAASGKNPEERAKRAESPWVPVTDPNKEIHPEGSHK